MKLREYIETEMHLRARAEYEGRNHKNGIYLQGMMSPQQALNAFQVIGDVKEIQQYFNGKRKIVWRKGENWKGLEAILKLLKQEGKR